MKPLTHFGYMSKRNTLILFLAILFFLLVSNIYGQQIGLASYYYRAQTTSSGKWFTEDKMWAASRTIKNGTKVLVTNLSNNKSVIVTIWDYGPSKRYPRRIIDLSRSAFRKISPVKQGLVKVRVEIIKK